jgi:hypothetical protein
MAWRGEQNAFGTRAHNQASGYDRMGRHLGQIGDEVMADTSSLAQGLGSVQAPGSPGGWHPTVLYLFVLVLAEMFVFGLVARLLR